YHLARKQRQINRADNFTESVKNAFDSLFFNDEEEYEEELVNELPYTHQMQLGGNKESYNEIMETTTAEKPKTAKELLLERTKRKFSSIQENLQNQASA
ncbi:hypothetical protein BWK59_14185, partial [Flavobacterium davisii]